MRLTGKISIHTILTRRALHQDKILRRDHYISAKQMESILLSFADPSPVWGIYVSVCFDLSDDRCFTEFDIPTCELSVRSSPNLGTCSARQHCISNLNRVKTRVRRNFEQWVERDPNGSCLIATPITAQAGVALRI